VPSKSVQRLGQRRRPIPLCGIMGSLKFLAILQAPSNQRLKIFSIVCAADALLFAGLLIFSFQTFANPIGWDGRGVDPNSKAIAHRPVPKPAPYLHSNAEALASEQGTAPTAYSPEWWEKEQAREAAEEQKLKRTMSICRGC
jgi:hypothetical protein